MRPWSIIPIALQIADKNLLFEGNSKPRQVGQATELLKPTGDHEAKRLPSKDVLDAQCLRIRHELSTRGTHVTVTKVVDALLADNKVRDLPELGIWNIHALTQLRLLDDVSRRVETLLCAGLREPIVTLYDLERFLCEHSGIAGVLQFGDLGLGPLLAHPRVRRVFRLDEREPKLTEIPATRCEDVYAVRRAPFRPQLVPARGRVAGAQRLHALNRSVECAKTLSRWTRSNFVRG